MDAERNALGRAEKGIFLAQQRAAQLAQIHRDDLARVRRRKGHAQLARGLVGEHRGEQRLAGDQPLARAQQLAEQAALALRAVAEHRVHRDAGVHEHHAAGLADRRLARVELDLDELHLGALDLIVHHVHCHLISPVLPARAPRAKGDSGIGLLREESGDRLGPCNTC